MNSTRGEVKNQNPNVKIDGEERTKEGTMEESQAPEPITETEAKRLRKAVDVLNRRSTFLSTVLRGFFAGIGSTLGVAVVLTLVYWLLNYLNFIPGATDVRDFLSTLRRSI